MVRIGDDVAWTSTDSRVVALHLATPAAVPCVLEESAAVIWQEIAEEGSVIVRELVERLSEVFGVDADEIRGHVETLISDLARLDLLAARVRHRTP